MRAASSSSLGIDEKYPIISQVQNGTLKVGYTSTSTQQLFNNPSQPTILNKGINKSVSGTKYGKKKPVAKIPDPQNFNLDNEYAAKTLITMDITTTDIVTIIVFLKKVRKDFKKYKKF